jgi:hypothetical protein
LTVPGYGPIANLEQLVLLNGLVTTSQGPDGKPLVEPPKVYGIFFRGESGYFQSDEPILFEGSVNIDPNKWIVKFDRYMMRINPLIAVIPPQMLDVALIAGVDPYQIQPAELVLLCSVHVRDPLTNQVFRHGVTFVNNAEANTKPLVSQHNDIQLVYESEYDREAKFALRGTTDNFDYVFEVESYYLDKLAEQFETSDSEEKEFPGILPIGPDGAIRQVTWSIGGGNPCTTRASRNSEHAFWLPKYQQRRGQERLKHFFDIPQPKAQPLNPLYGG